jgi:polyisoprenoid-binding protein YceI
MDADTRLAVRPGTYEIDPVRSAVRFTATHAFGLGPVHGTVGVRAGVLVVAEEPGRSTVTVRLDPASFRTDKPRRDADVKGGRFLDVAAYPEMTFTSTVLSRSADGWRLTGTLTVRGTPAQVVLDLDEAWVTDRGVRFTATARVDRYAFLTTGRGLIGRYVDVAVEVWATAA